MSHIFMHERLIVQCLVLSVFVLAYTQGEYRRESALFFAYIHLGFNFFLSDSAGEYGFIMGAFFDLIIMAYLATCVKHIRQITFELWGASACFILLNIVGWAGWSSGLTLDYYVLSTMVLYIWVILALTRGEKLDHDSFRLDNYGDFCYNRLQRMSNVFNFKKKEAHT